MNIFKVFNILKCNFMLVSLSFYLFQIVSSSFNRMMDSDVSCQSSSGESSKPKNDSLSDVAVLNGKSSNSVKNGESSKSKDDSLSDVAVLNGESSSGFEDGESTKSKDDSSSDVAVSNGESSKSTDEGLSSVTISNGETSSSNEDYSSLIGAVVTQQMIQEEKMLEEKTLLEEKKLKEKILKEQRKELEEVCYKRLNLLLNRSSLYAQFMADKLQRDQLKDAKKQMRAEKRKAKDQGEGEKKRLKGTTDSPRKRKVITPLEEEEEEEVEEDEDIESIAAEISKASNGQPSLLTGGVMHPYQLEGYEWLKVIFENGVNGILADEMGLGKTIQTIAFIAYLIEMGVTGPFFVCGPLSTVPNWHAEFERFTPLIPTVVYHGDKETREQLRTQINKKVKKGKLTSYPVFITSYTIALNDAKYLKKYQWKLLVIDEAHRIKNFQCKLVTSLKLFQTMHRLLLTGTPLQNNLSELWSLLNFILPEIFDDLKVFESWFDVTRFAGEGVKNEIIAKEQEKQIVSKIHQILAPFLLRRTKAEVALKLPQKKEVLVHAPLTKLQQEYYTAVLNKTIASTLGIKSIFDEEIVEGKRASSQKMDFNEIYKLLQDNKFDDIPKALSAPPVSKEINDVLADVNLNVRNTMMLLRKVCNHPYSISYPIDPVTSDYKIDEDLIRNSGKLLVMDAMLPELKKRGHKILLFSQFVSMLEILQDYCSYRGYNYCLLHGSMSLAERTEEIKHFNSSNDAFIFLISTKAGGLGLNLAAADTVIIYDSDWNPQGDIQAQDRCHRIGQNKPVVVYRLVIPNTMDERIVERANAKRKLEKVIIKKGRFNSNHSISSKLSIEELIELLQSSDLSGFVKTDENSVLSPEKLAELLDRSDMADSHSD